jgi:two-component system, OmpR family, response regulator
VLPRHSTHIGRDYQTRTVRVFQDKIIILPNMIAAENEHLGKTFDDDELLRAALVEWLWDAGFHVTDFSDPRDALGSSDGANPPDVLITDIDLGTTQNGFQVAAMAHELWPAVLAIVISAMPSEEAGPQLDPRDRYLRKPFPGTALLQEIDQLTSVPS